VLWGPPGRGGGWWHATRRAERGRNQASGIEEADFAAVCDFELAEIARRRKRYLGDRERAEVAGRIAIVVVDGIATGATTRAALRAVRMGHPSHLVLAVPVAPTESLTAMGQEADEVVCLEDPDFGAIGFYYSDFRQVSDEEVIETFEQFPVHASPRTCVSVAADTTG
jgi:putative phosphoribosyl transferase